MPVDAGQRNAIAFAVLAFVGLALLVLAIAGRSAPAAFLGIMSLVVATAWGWLLHRQGALLPTRSSR